jgi:hypothetical protein
MSDEHGHTRRIDDWGFGKLIKFIPYLLLVFSCGSWYESSQANAALVEKLIAQMADHDHRLTQVESAVIYLKELVHQEREKR